MKLYSVSYVEMDLVSCAHNLKCVFKRAFSQLRNVTYF